MKLTIILGLMTMLLALSLAGCGFSKDAEVKAFMSELDKVTNDVSAKINADPSEKGVDEAQKAWEAGKPGLKAKWDGIKEAREIQVTESVRKDMEKNMTTNVEKLTGLASKMRDPAASQKYIKLITDFSSLFTETAK